MQRNDARLQVLTLMLLALFGFLAIDVASVQAVMDDLGLAGLDAEAFSEEAPAEAEPAPAPRWAEGPSLAVGGKAAGCDHPAGTAQEIALECCPAASAFEREPAAGAAEQLGTRIGAHEGVITSMWLERRPGVACLEAATRAFALTPAQRDAWARALEDAQRDLDDLRHVPDADGRSLHDLITQVRQQATDPKRAVALASALAAFQGRELNGGETYAEARRRLLQTWRARLREELTPAQQAAFDKHDVDRLIDPGMRLQLRFVSKA